MEKKIIVLALICLFSSAESSRAQMKFAVAGSSEPVAIDSDNGFGNFIIEGENIYMLVTTLTRSGYHISTDEAGLYSYDDDLQLLGGIQLSNNENLYSTVAVTEKNVIVFILDHNTEKNLLNFKYNLYEHGTLELVERNILLKSFEYEASDELHRTPSIYCQEIEDQLIVYGQVYEAGNFVTSNPRYFVLILDSELNLAEEEGPILDGFLAPPLSRLNWFRMMEHIIS